jgi:hypothetical protein
MVVNELLKTRTRQGLPSDLSYWRDKTGHEVDIVLEREGQPIPVEIKSGHGMRGFSEDGEPAPLSYLFPMLRSLLLPALMLPTVLSAQVSTLPAMMYGDTTRKGVPFSKDPHVVAFGGRYLLYYTLPAHSDKNHPVKGTDPCTDSKCCGNGWPVYRWMCRHNEPRARTDRRCRS